MMFTTKSRHWLLERCNVLQTALKYQTELTTKLLNEKLALETKANFAIDCERRSWGLYRKWAAKARYWRKKAKGS